MTSSPVILGEANRLAGSAEEGHRKSGSVKEETIAVSMEEKGVSVGSREDGFPEGGYQAWATAFGASVVFFSLFFSLAL